MHFNEVTPERWKRIRDVASSLLDEPSDPDGLLERECAGDSELRDAVLHLAAEYSEAEELFGCEPLRLTSLEEPVPETPRRIGPYLIAREIGRGGMGAVYLATRDDGAYEKQVAIKTLPFGNRDQHRLFLRERQILAVLEHPGITRLLDGGTAADGTPYLVMDYVDGAPLTEYLRDKPATASLTLFLDVCDAVQYAHQNMVIHCDLKPSNILVDAGGSVKVLDFGIAKLLESGGGHTALTVAGMTPAYASPEQLSARPLNTLSDVYSLGVILYHLLAGHLPSDAPTSAGEPPRPPSRWNQALRGDLDAIVMKAVEAEPARRYQSVNHLAEDIRRYLACKPVHARQRTWWYRSIRYAQRRRWRVAAAAAFAIVLILGAVGTLSQKRKAERRFNEVRKLAQSVVFQYQDDLGDLQGSTALRARMATDAVRYLDRISADSGPDETLERETALAYRKVGEVQGYGRFANLGDVTGADGSLEKSASLLQQLVDKRPDDRQLRNELAITLERRANVLSLAGRNVTAKQAIERSISLLDGLGDAAGREKTAAWRELSAIEDRLGRNKAGIEAARKAVRYSESAEVQREDRALAYGRLATAVAVGIGPNQEALDAAKAALSLYGEHGSACGGNAQCRIGYVTAIVQLALIHNYAGRYNEVLRLFAEREGEIRELVQRDPYNRLLLRQLRQSVTLQGHAYQSLGRIPESLRKLRESIDTALEIVRADPGHPEAPCLVILARAKYGEVLVQNTDRVAEAESELQAALALANSAASDTLGCLDYRKVAVLNLGRVAERKGNWAEGMEWRRETVRNAMRYAAKSPGEPLGLVIVAGANYELGLGGLEAARHGDRTARLEEARAALLRASAIYRQLQGMGSPLYNQYPGWPERTAALLATVERNLAAQ